MERGECLASFANSNTNAFLANKNRNGFVPAPLHNAKIVVNRDKGLAYLRATKKIYVKRKF
jgi:hypothetical protein